MTYSDLTKAMTRAVVCTSLCIGGLACGDLSGMNGKQGLPAGTGDPGSFNTPDGAIGLYNATLAAFQYIAEDSVTEIGGTRSSEHPGVFVEYVIASGMLADELRAGNLNPNNNPPRFTFPPISDGVGVYNYLDARQLTEGNPVGVSDLLYTGLQGIRGGANMAIGVLTHHAPNLSPALAGHMYALMGYAEIFLGDLYCSGVPLSTLDSPGDFTYHAGSTTADVYRDAVTQFDLAIASSADSSRILNLAKVGKGRALLALGRPDSAALAVAGVPDGFAYQLTVDWTAMFSAANNRRSSSNVSVANTEGLNGLPYITDGATDPRVASDVWALSFAYRVPLYVPLKYSADFTETDPSTPRVGTIMPITVADWIEARLIRAEAALSAGDVDGWLAELNYLRHNAASADLESLDDPGDAASRVALLFKERAYWLFISGHRQGDMRRMIRQYHVPAESVYPKDVYPPGTAFFTRYGTDVTAPIPVDERINPLFAGCLSRGA